MSGKLTQFALICLFVLPVWLIVRKPWRRPARREIVLGAFVAYIAALLVMALEGTWTAPADMLASARERLSTMEGVYLTPFATIRQQISALPSDDSLTQLLGNTLLFAPWGFFLPMLWRRFRHPLMLVLMCLSLTCFIEGTQLFIGRTVDVDDLILNFLGSMCGGGLFGLLNALFPRLFTRFQQEA